MKNQRKWLQKQKIHIGTGNSYAPTNPIHDILHQSISEPSSSAELNNFLKSHRIINVEKRLIDGERGTGWVFLVEYTENEGANPRIQ